MFIIISSENKHSYNKYSNRIYRSCMNFFLVFLVHFFSPIFLVQEFLGGLLSNLPPPAQELNGPFRMYHWAITDSMLLEGLQ